ncbi:MAG: transposase [Nannocystaceae bacterium]|nr:transposase [Nannocystaceae bacterium]
MDPQALQARGGSQELKLDAAARHALRQGKSLPLLKKFYAWVVKMKPKLGRTSTLAEAVRYAANQRA